MQMRRKKTRQSRVISGESDESAESDRLHYRRVTCFIVPACLPLNCVQLFLCVVAQRSNLVAQFLSRTGELAMDGREQCRIRNNPGSQFSPAHASPGCRVIQPRRCSISIKQQGMGFRFLFGPTAHFARWVICTHYIDSRLIGCIDTCQRRDFHLVD